MNNIHNLDFLSFDEFHYHLYLKLFHVLLQQIVYHHYGLISSHFVLNAILSFQIETLLHLIHLQIMKNVILLYNDYLQYQLILYQIYDYHDNHQLNHHKMFYFEPIIHPNLY